MSNLGVDKKTQSDFNRNYKRYTNLQFMLDDSYVNEDEALRKRYDLIKKSSPKLVKDEDGTLRVVGLVK